MKKRSSNGAVPVLRPRLLSVAVAACFTTPVAFALPTGPQVVVGSAAFTQQTGALTVTNTPGTVINWQGFSIGANEAARFVQQGPASSVLNRVVGAEASAILGALQSNGRVWLVNPNGILFGPSAQIDVQGLVASTLAISNRDFLAGKLNFEAGAIAGGIRNEGSIKTREGGSVYLVAPGIENSGIIHSPGGEVMLAAGRSVSLVEAAHPDVQMVVSAPTDQAVNLGQILVESGRASLFGTMLAQRGIVSASSAGTDAAGNIVFRAGRDVTLAAGSRTVADGGSGGTISVRAKEGTNLVSGEVSAQGTEGKGGSIQLLGERVGLVDHARVEASGENGGGTVLLGGDYQGGNASIQNAGATYVSRNAAIAADARQNGDGGKVIVWSDDATRAYGTISAKGGANSGDGGFVETSGKVFLDFDAKVDTSAARGRSGTLLLDPFNVEITDALTGTFGGTLPNFSASELTSTISAGAIETAGLTNDVVISATGTVTVKNLGAVITDQTINIGGAGKSITLTGNGGVSFEDKNDGIATNGGNINLTAAAGSLTNIGTLTTGFAGGRITLVAGNQIDLRNTVNGDEVRLSAGAGGIAQSANAPIYASELEAVASGPVILDLANNQVRYLAGSSVGGFRFRSTCCGDLIISTVGTTPGVTNSGGGGIAIDGAEGITVSQPVYSGESDIRLVASGNDLVIENTVSTGTSGDPNPATPTGTVTLESSDSGYMFVKSVVEVGTGFVRGDNVIVKGANLYFDNAGGSTPVISGHSSVRTITDGIGFDYVASETVNLEATKPGDGMVRVGPFTPSYPITVGGYCYGDSSCLLFSGSDLNNGISAQQLVIGNSGLSNPTSSGISVDAMISRSGVVAFDTLGTVQGTGSERITADALAIRAYGAYGSNPSLSLNTNVGTVAASLIGPGPAEFHIFNYDGEGSPPLTIGSVTIDGTPISGISRAGPSAASVGVDNRDDITVANPIDAGAGSVYIYSSGAISGTGLITATGADGITLAAFNGIGSAGSPLLTRTGKLETENYASGDLAIANNSATPGALQLAKAQNWGGPVQVENNGAMTLAADGGEWAFADGGGVKLIANGVLTMENGVYAAAGDIVLKGTGFVNNLGADILSAPSGRWLVYSDNPAGNVFGLLNSGNQALWNRTYALNPPASITQPGNRYVFAQQPTLTFATGNLSKTFGTYNGAALAALTSPPPTGLVNTGLLDAGGAPYSNAFVQDTLGTVYSGTPSFSSTGSAPAAAVGTYPIVPGGLTSLTGYGFANTGSLTVNPATLQAIAASLTGTASKTYDGTTDATLSPGNFLLTGFVSTDSATVTKTTGTYASKNAGSGILVSTTLAPTDFSAVGSTNLSNYTLPTSASGNIGSITPASLGLSGLTANNKVYDATTAATVSGTLTGLVPGDAVVLAASSASFNDKNVGTAKPVTVGGLALTGADAGNYSLSAPSGATLAADITPASLTVSGLSAQNKVYDGNTVATLGGTATFSGLLGTDTVALGGSASASFNNKNVGTAKPVTVTGLTLTGADAGNYTINSTAATSADITPASLTVSAVTAQNKVYDGTTAATVTGTLGGVVAGDVVGIAAPGASFNNRNVGTAKPVTIAGLTLTGADAGNYLLGSAPATTTADITVRPVSNWVGGAGGDWSNPANWDALPDQSNVLAVSVPGGTTVTYDAATGSTSLNVLTTGGLNMAGGSLTIANSLSVSSSFSQGGGTLAFGAGASASITQASGSLNLPALTLASLSLNAPAGAIGQSGPIVASALTTQSQAGTTLTNGGNRIASFGAANTGAGDIALVNSGTLTITGISNSGGSILVDNTGAVTTTGSVSAPAGVVSILAHSPITIGAGGVAAGGNIVLTASDTPGAGDTLTLSGPVSSTGGGSIAMASGDSLIQNASVSTNGGAVNAVSQSGSISMAPGASTSTGGGSIGYTASAGNIALASLNAGSGAIGLEAGGDIGSVPGFSGANLIAGQAVIAAGGNANLSAQVGLLDVKVKGLYSITDVLKGGAISNVQTTATPAVNQVTSTVVAATQSVTTQAAGAGGAQQPSDAKEKEEEAKKKQQAAPTTIMGAGTDVRPKNYCN